MNGKNKFFNILNYTFLFLFAVTAIYPLIYILTISLMPADEYLRGGIVLFPKKISFGSIRAYIQEW